MCSQRRQLACRLGGWKAGSGWAGTRSVRRGGDRASAQFGSPPRHPASRIAVTTWRWAGGRVTEQGGCCTRPRRPATPVPRWTKGGWSREGPCGGRGGGLPVVGSVHRGHSAPTSPSLASRPACPCRAHLLCRPASPELCWAPRCGTPMGLLCQGSASAPAQRPGGEGQTGGCACGGRGSWEHGTVFPATRGGGGEGFMPHRMTSD